MPLIFSGGRGKRENWYLGGALHPTGLASLQYTTSPHFI
jgi:hypothetical protein